MPAAATFRGVTYVFSRYFDRATGPLGMLSDTGVTQALIYTVEGGRLRTYCELPSGGDCAHVSAVEVDDDMLVCYYSSHESSTDIYLARVPLKT